MIQKLKATLGLSANKKRTREDEVMKSDEEEDDDEEAEISFDERIKFTDNVRKLTIEQMTSVVKMLQEECPDALNDLDSDKLQIKVDSIDKATFDKLMDYTGSWIKSGDKDVKMKPSGGDGDENAKSNQDDNDDNAEDSENAHDRSSRQDDDEEESKNEQSIDSSKYGPEGKRFKAN